MDVDPEIAPLLARSRAALDGITAELRPMLAELAEDPLVAHYTIEEQARLYLSSAFTLAFALYCLDRLQHRQHQTVKVSGRKQGGDASSKNGNGGETGPAAVDPQLSFKIDRITDYIKKLREITELATQQQQQQHATEGSATNTAATVTTAGRKRGRDDAGAVKAPAGTATASTSNLTAAAATAVAPSDNGGDEEDMGDSAMFGVVSRVPGKTGVLAERLLRQLGGSAGKDSTGTTVPDQ